MVTTSKKNFMAIALILIAIIVAIIYIWAVFPKLFRSETAPLPKITVGFPAQTFDTAILILAHYKGYFYDQGIDVSLLPLQGSEVAMGVASGKINIGMVGAQRLYAPIEKGAPIKMLSMISNKPTELFVRPDAGITSLKDLEGRNVSYGPGGGAKELSIKYALKKEGVDLKKVKFIEIEKIYLPMALMEKRTVDAVVVDEPNNIDECKRMGAVLLLDWRAKKYNELPAGVMVSVNTDFLKSNEENVSRFLKAMIEANRYFRDHFEESAIIVTKYIKNATNGAVAVKPDEFEKIVNEGMVTYSLWDDPKMIVELAQTSYETGQVSRVLSIDDLYDLRFKDLLESAQYEIYGQPKD